jgi:ketosteroid isomerase-like protein
MSGSAPRIRLFIERRKTSELNIMKKLIIFIFAFTMATACSQNSGTKLINTSDKNIEIVKKVYEQFNKHDWSGMANLYSETPEFKDPTLGIGTVTQTRDQIILKYTDLQKAFPDIKDEIIQIYPSSDKYVIVEFISKGTAPDGTKFELPICTIFTVENGKIVKDFSYFDNF